MDASQVMSGLNTAWSGLLDQYYDHIAEEYIKWMSQEYHIPIEELQERAKPVKEQVISQATANVIAGGDSHIKKKPKTMAAIKADASKAKLEASTNGGSVYAKMARKELVETCRSRKLPVKRKNLDMVDQLVENDDTNRAAGAGASTSTEEMDLSVPA